MGGDKKVLVAGLDAKLIEFMMEEIKKEGLPVEDESVYEGVAKHVGESRPDVILLDIQWKEQTAKKIIDAIQQIDDIETRIVCYAYFKKEDEARRSDLVYFYTHNVDQLKFNDKVELYFVGNIREDSFGKVINTYIKGDPAKVEEGP